MSVISWFSNVLNQSIRVDEDNPLPVNQVAVNQTFAQMLQATDPLSYLAMQGRVFYSADGDQNDMVTGQTSFAATTPTFLLNVPEGTTAVPLFFGLNQAGSVAGGDILIAMEMDKVKRYGSGGTAEKSLNARTGGPDAKCILYSNPTAVTGYGIRTFGVQVAPDISPAEGAIYEIVWTPAGSLDFLVGPSAWLIYTYAGTTGASWLWQAKWAEFPTSVGIPPAITN